MFFDGKIIIAGDNLAERNERLERAARKGREKNRADGIPDMEPERHEPMEWFSEVGYHSILGQIGASSPDYDWSAELDSESRCRQARGDYLEARKADMQHVIQWLRNAEIFPRPNHVGATIGGRKIDWADRMPGLKTWAGQQKMDKLLKLRQAAMGRGEIRDVTTFRAPLGGASGWDRGTCLDAIDIGFSPDKIELETMTSVATELLAVIGLETIPITVLPDGRYCYDAGGKRWAFRVEDRGEYYGRWGGAEEIR